MAQANEDKLLYFVDGMHPSYTAHPEFGWIRRGITRELKKQPRPGQRQHRWPTELAGSRSGPSRGREDHQRGHDRAVRDTGGAPSERDGHQRRARQCELQSLDRSIAVKAYVSSEGCRVRLVFLPTYSPNLNLIERLWWFLKKIALWNEYYPTFAGFKSAIDEYIFDPGNCREQRTSLITDQFRFMAHRNPNLRWQWGISSHRCSPLRMGAQHRRDAGGTMADDLPQPIPLGSRALILAVATAFRKYTPRFFPICGWVLSYLAPELAPLGVPGR